MNIDLPETCLVALIGASASGKSTFAQQHFLPGEVLSSDTFRQLVANDEADQGATKDAFEALYFVARRRLARGLLTVIDATNVQPDARRHVVRLAREFDVLPVAVVLDLPVDELLRRHRQRTDRSFGPPVIERQVRELRRSSSKLPTEGFRHVTVLRSAQEVDAATVHRARLHSNLRDRHGPFDIIGDVHGCLPELLDLLAHLGYDVHPDLSVTPPAGRTAVFLGDLVDRGPDTPGVLRLVMNMVHAGQALCVPGNHDAKLVRALHGHDVRVSHGLQESLEQLERETPEFRRSVTAFLEGLTSHYVLDEGQLVVAHAGMKEVYQGRASKRVREFALYGETTGETDEFGLPVRVDWAADYRGAATVVYGHTPVGEPQWLNRTINIDTGCVFGHRLTALRYPERELVSVPARAEYARSARPLTTTQAALTAQQTHDELIDLADVTGRRIIETRLRGRVTIHEDQAAAALEVTGRFAIDPRWLVYVPPTMSPCETSAHEGYLEYPTEAFEHYRRGGVRHVVCEEKHMGSRAVLVVARDAAVARTRFGVTDGARGAVYSRSGRRLLDDPAMEAQLLGRVSGALTDSGTWEALNYDWVVLDAELLPWSLKADQLIREQYAAVGAAATTALRAALGELETAAGRGVPVTELLERTRTRSGMAEQYVHAYRQYVRHVRSLVDIRVAPFHLLASEGAVHANRDHGWHLRTLAGLAHADPDLLIRTAYREVDLHDDTSTREAERWWLDLTARGGEGMVVKPREFTALGTRGLVQPGVKVRGREYLRIIYGPEYTAPGNLARLRARHLNAKRARALREFALGVEGLERFVRREPLRRVHECALGVLALESDPIDPRL